MNFRRLVGLLIMVLILSITLIIANSGVESDADSIDIVESTPEIPLVFEEEIEEMIVLEVEDVQAIARTLYGECRGIESEAEKAAVAWVILNRVDSGDYGDSVLEVVSAPNQFVGYNENHPLWADLVSLSEDVLRRWYREKSGETEVGRVLPPDYLWFTGDGKHNHFRNQYKGGIQWDWSFENPYED